MLETLLIIWVFILGACVGSLLNVIILRGREGEKITGRSHCLNCQTKLSAKELIPILSFLFQKGRCLHCGAVLLVQYPLVELGTGAAFALSFAALAGNTPWLWILDDWKFISALIISWFVISASVVILVSDLRFKIIPNGAVLAIFLGGLARVFWQTSSGNFRPWPDILTILILTLFLWLIWFISKGKWMGLGDVKLIFAISLLVGYPNSITAFLFSFWSGGLAGALLLLSQKKKWRQQIPFGPFILLGALLSQFWTKAFLDLTGLSIFL